MKLVEISELKNIADYEVERETWCPAMISLKDRRRIRVGENLTFLFENRETVRYQIQEMMRIERIVKTADIQHELATYNELIPGANELSASLLIEFETPEERQVRLAELLGLEDHIWLEVGGQRSKALFDARQIATDRVSSVQYIKFALSPQQVQRWKDGARIVLDHPKYKAEHDLTPQEASELAADLLS